MAVGGHCSDSGVRCTRITAFSNPRNSHGGFPTGVSIGTSLSCTVGNLNNPPCDADAVDTLAETASLVAAYWYRDRARLDGGQRLFAGHSLQVEGAACQLLFQTDGNLVAYAENVAYWNAGTVDATGGAAVLQTDGNLVVYDAAGVASWNSGTAGNPGAYLVIQRDCNVVLYSAECRTVVVHRTAVSLCRLFAIMGDPPMVASSCPSRIRCQVATGSWTKSRQWET